jgi:hypothetical protein
MTEQEKADLKKDRSLFLYNLNKSDWERQKKALEQAELQASGKFPRRGRRLKTRPATGNPPTTLL